MKKYYLKYWSYPAPDRHYTLTMSMYVDIVISNAFNLNKKKYFLFFLRLPYLHSSCSHTQVFGQTLVHKFLISWSHSEWYTLFFRWVK